MDFINTKTYVNLIVREVRIVFWEKYIEILFRCVILLIINGEITRRKCGEIAEINISHDGVPCIHRIVVWLLGSLGTTKAALYFALVIAI